jgi:hypothetical protein
MLLEHGWTRAKRFARCSAKRAIWTTTCRDYGDNERLTLGRLPAWRMLADELIHAVLYLHIASGVGRIVRFTLLVDVPACAAEPALGANCAALCDTLLLSGAG